MCTAGFYQGVSGRGTVSTLGTFRPTAYNREVIRDELERWLRERGVRSARIIGSKNRLPIAVRDPTEQPSYFDWHRDGCDWLIMWTNGTATDLRDRRGTHWCMESFDVVLVNDRIAEHKAPPIEPGRWFARLLDPILED